MSTLASDFGTGQVFLSMLWFFLFFIWIWLLIIVFSDIFRSHDMGGFAKALWVIFVIILPYLGVLVYLIARGHKMAEHAQEAAQRRTPRPGSTSSRPRAPRPARPTSSSASPTSRQRHHHRRRVREPEGQGHQRLTCPNARHSSVPPSPEGGTRRVPGMGVVPLCPSWAVQPPRTHAADPQPWGQLGPRSPGETGVLGLAIHRPEGPHSVARRVVG